MMKPSIEQRQNEMTGKILHPLLPGVSRTGVLPNTVNTKCTQNQLNRLSLAPMRFGRGETSPTAFSAKAESQTVYLNRLSLERMLFGRGEISPTAFSAQVKHWLGQGNDCRARAEGIAAKVSFS
jgi:hypothetical protein